MLTVLRNCTKGTIALKRGNVTVLQAATLTGRTTRGEPLKLKKPFPYRKRELTQIEALLDPTIGRLDSENAKMIVVEGPIASGKSAFMKALAEEFDMYALDQPTMDKLYITRTGFDLREFDDQLPESVRSYDHKNFCMDPYNVSANDFQITMLNLKFECYVDALAHILNTGQGVILERSHYSDYVFVEAMYSQGYITKKVRDLALLMQKFADPITLKPHVVIYLDVPVNKVQERIKARNLCYEVNSTALTPAYLQELENLWKTDYLKKASLKSEVLVYDWSDGGDIELVIEDLERLNLNPSKQNRDSTKFSEWLKYRRLWRHLRLQYTNEKDTLMRYIQVPCFDIEELMAPSEDLELRRKLYDSAPGCEFEVGYNPSIDGFLNVLLGLKTILRQR